MGVSTETQDPDLATAFAGGDTFISRMEQLSAAKAASSQAEASLNLGMSAKAALDLYQGKLADADRALVDARKQAQAIVDAANVTAAATIKDGEDKRVLALAAADSARVDADAYATETRGRADAVMQSATASITEAQSKLANVAVLEKAAQDKAADADVARSSAAAAEAKHNAALETLRAACAKVLATG